ncbi:tetratricopeptide repeat protein [bacterium]|jgi:thioredoxin-like negative regulator of GroEL|nr:tetratricopeptide repeat protein [bacterium]MBT7311735.1 tetratricopeptide repeat protein [bacterium]
MKLLKLAMVALVVFTGTAFAEEVQWLEGQTWDEIISMAQEQDTHIVIDFYATWCGPCKMLDNQVYNVSDVVQTMSSLVNFKVDVDKEEYKELTKLFKISAMPTVVVCRKDGSEIDRFLGFRPAPIFLSTLKDYLVEKNTYADVKARLEKDPDNPELLLLVAAKYSDKSMQAEAKAALQKVLELDPKNEGGFLEEALPSLGFTELMGGNFPIAVELLERSIALIDDPEAKVEIFGMIAMCYEKIGDSDKQLATLEKLVETAPENPQALNGAAWAMAEAGKNLEKATDLAMKAVVLSDEDPNIMDTLAEIYFKRDMNEDAIKWIEKAITKDPGNKYFKEQLIRFSS